MSTGRGMTTTRRQVNGATFTHRKIVPVITNVPVHAEVDDRRANVAKQFKDDKLSAGVRATNNHDYVEAARQFSLIQPPTTTSLYLSGCARVELRYYSQMQEAVQDFTKCIALAAQNPHAEYGLEVWYKRAQAYHFLRQYNEAIRDYTEFIKRCQTTGERANDELYPGLIGRGQTYQAMYELDMAMQDINEANRLTNNNDPYYLCCRAGVSAARHERAKALEDIHKANAVGCEDDYEALLQRGIVYAELGDHDNAVKDFSKAAKLSPKTSEQSDICVRAGMSFYALNDKREAYQWFERAITLHPLNADAHYRLGMMQREKGQYKEALKSLTRAHELSPVEGDILLERAIVHQHLGDIQEAKHDHKRGEQLNSSVSAITTMLDKRIKTLREERDRTGASALNHLQLAMAHDGLINQKKDFKTKRKYYTVAVMEYREAIQADTKYLYPQACALLALCQRKMNDFNEAHEIHLEFYRLLDRHKEAVYHWKTYLVEVKDKMESGQLEPHLDEVTVSKLIQMELNRRKKDVDIETYQGDIHDKYKNQLAFYEQMRADLAHLLAAVSIFNLDDNAIIENVEDTTNRVGKIVKLIGEGEKSVLDIESELNSNDKVEVKKLRKADLDTIRMKLKSFGNLGDMMDQLDVAQLVARHLCTRYHAQFLCLKPNNRYAEEDEVVEEKKRSWWNCCGGPKWVFPKQATYASENEGVRRISTFAIAYIIHAINSDSIKVSSGNKSSRKDALATTLVLVACAAHLTHTGVLSALRPSNRNLPISASAVEGMLKKSKVVPVEEDTSLIEWDLYAFFQAPGVFYHSDVEPRKIHFYRSGPSMLPDKYGYRLGTKEEVDLLKKLKREDTE